MSFYSCILYRKRRLILLLGVILMVILQISVLGCSKQKIAVPNESDQQEDSTLDLSYPGVPISDIYEVTIVKNGIKEKSVVFISSCPVYKLGDLNMTENDQYPLAIFAGRTINWCKFSFSGTVLVEVKILNSSKVPLSGNVKVLPSRHGIAPTVEGNLVRFTLNSPGQLSVEIGENGYKNGLILFADPPETDIPSQTSGSYKILKNSSKNDITSVPASFSGLYFKAGVHNIGVYNIPSNIKNIYFENGSWVYGSLIMDGKSDVKIFGRGVLSSAKFNYRESHCIEAINQSNNITIEGIVVADPKYFAVRLIGQNNTVKWTKVIGGWVYNCDGIAAYAGSTVSNCFIWANDDAIKIYRDNITWSDCVVWQLNNGGVIQMAWGGSNATNIRVSRIDVLRAEWNKPGFNRALINCVGNRYKEPGKYGIQSDWIIEDIVTESPIPVIFNIAPDEFSPNHIHNITFRNWKVTMTMNKTFQNAIIGNDPARFIDGFVFDNFHFNGVKLTQSNWLEVTGLITSKFVQPEFK